MASRRPSLKEFLHPFMTKAERNPVQSLKEMEAVMDRWVAATAPRGGATITKVKTDG